jgi:hypothetical protein
MAAEIKDFIVRQGIITQGTNFVTSSTSQLGALQVNSGAAVSKNLIVGTTATVWGDTDLKGKLSVGGDVTLANLTATGIVSLTNETAATTGGAGALQVAGGIYVEKNLVINSTDANTGTLASNALYVAGGVGIEDSLTVNGDVLFKNRVTFSGTATYVQSTNTYYTDNLIDLHVPPGGVYEPWELDDGKDIGHVYHYYKGEDKRAFLGFANDTAFLEWYSEGVEGVGTYAGTKYGTFKTGGIRLVDSDVSFSTSTGALQMIGGIGANNIYLATTASAQTLVGRTLTAGRVALVGVNGAITDDESLTYDADTNILSATVTTANTATNIAGGARGTMFFQTSTGVTWALPIGSADQVLTVQDGVPTWKNASDTTAGAATTATNLAGGTTNQVPYQVSPGITGFFGPGTSGQLLMSAGTAAGGPVFTNTSSIYVNSAVNAEDLYGGTAGQLVYQSATGVTAFAGPGTANDILTSNGTSGPVYKSTASIYVNSAVNAEDLYGGTAGQLVYQSGTGVTDFVGPGTSGQLLMSAGASAPVYTNTSSIYVGTAVDADRVKGGTAGQILYQSSTGVTAFAGPGTAGQILLSAGASAPVYTNTASIHVGAAQYSVTATNVEGGAAGSIVYQAAEGDTDFIGIGGAGSLLQSNGSTATFINTSSIYVNSAVNAEDLYGGTAGQLVYQSAPGVTAFAGPGTAGQILLSAGASAPVYTNTGSIHVGDAVNAHITNNIRGGTTGTIFYQSDVDTTAALSIGASNQILAVENGLPVWKNASDTSAGTATTATNVGGGTAGQIPYQISTGTTGFVGPGTSGQLLMSNGTSAPTYVSTSNIYVNSAVNAETLLGGTAGQLVYQSATGVTAFAGPGTAGEVLVSNGTGAPAYQNTLTLAGTTSVHSTDSGAFQVAGGVGIGGGLFVGGQVTATNVVTVATVENATTTATGALRVGGGVGIHLDAVIGGDVTIGSVQSGTVVPAVYTNNTLLATYTSGTLAASTEYSLDTFAAATYSSAKYFVQVKAGTDVHVTEITLFHNGSGVFLNEFATAWTSGAMAEFDATLDAGTVTLKVTPAQSSTVVKVVRMSITA